MGEQLKPCPMCDCPPAVEDGDGVTLYHRPAGGDSGWYVECDRCGIQTSEEEKIYVVASWNQRATQPSPIAAKKVEDVARELWWPHHTSRTRSIALAELDSGMPAPVTIEYADFVSIVRNATATLTQRLAEAEELLWCWLDNHKQGGDGKSLAAGTQTFLAHPTGGEP